MKRLRWLLFCLLCHPSDGSAQIITVPDEHFLQEVAHFQVKDLSQFMNRFNGGDQLVFKNDTAADRYKNLLGLLNLSDTAFRHDKNTFAFIRAVSGKDPAYQLALTDSNWFAAAQCVFLYHGKERPVRLWLRLQLSANGGNYWALAGVQSELFAGDAHHDNERLFINPMNHEVNFSELSKALAGKHGVASYTTEGFRTDPLSAFLAYVRNGDLQFKNIASVEFNFLQVEGWFFTVREFFRAELNSGWLIAAVRQMSPEEKVQFKRSHLIE